MYELYQEEEDRFRDFFDAHKSSCMPYGEDIAPPFPVELVFQFTSISTNPVARCTVCKEEKYIHCEERLENV